MIENIKQGMTAAQVFDILNRLIDEHNKMMTAVGGALVDGKFDYKGLANKPRINSVELLGDLTQADLEISIDTTVVRELSNFRQRIGDAENTLLQKVSTADLTTKLADYAKGADLPDVSVLATKQELKRGLAEKVATSDLNTVLTQLNTAIGSKADAGEVPTVAQWQVLKADMDAKATAAENAKTGAEAAAGSMAPKANLLEVVDRLKLVIKRVNQSANYVYRMKGGTCPTSGEVPTSDCITDISNSFTFE